MSVHDDTLQGLSEILEYVRGDKTKARSMTVALPDDETEQLFYQKFERLSNANKHRAIGYIDGLLQAAGK